MSKGFSIALQSLKSMAHRIDRPLARSTVACPSFERSPALDALRGIAALAVMLFHLWVVLPLDMRDGNFVSGDGWIAHLFEGLMTYTPARIAVAGPAAVALFFVLSGYVLSVSICSHPNLTYRDFLVRRTCRIFLPYAIFVLLSALIYLFIKPTASATSISLANLGIWNSVPDLKLVLGHLLMVGTARYESLDPPIWSLVIEMRMAVVFPLLVAAVLRKPLSAIALVIALYAAMAHYMTATSQTSPYHLIGSIALTLEYMPLFVAGILVFKHRDELSFLYSTVPGWLRLCVPVLVVTAFCVPNMSPIASTSMIGKTSWLVVLSVASAVVIVFAMNARGFGRFLCTPTLQWLGRVSFSLYLVHELVLTVLVSTLDGRLPNATILLLTVPTSLMLASVAYRWIEVPCMALGRSMTKPKPRSERLKQGEPHCTG